MPSRSRRFAGAARTPARRPLRPARRRSPVELPARAGVLRAARAAADGGGVRRSARHGRGARIRRREGRARGDAAEARTSGRERRRGARARWRPGGRGGGGASGPRGPTLCGARIGPDAPGVRARISWAVGARAGYAGGWVRGPASAPRRSIAAGGAEAEAQRRQGEGAGGAPTREPSAGCAAARPAAHLEGVPGRGRISVYLDLEGAVYPDMRPDIRPLPGPYITWKGSYIVYLEGVVYLVGCGTRKGWYVTWKGSYIWTESLSPPVLCTTGTVPYLPRHSSHTPSPPLPPLPPSLHISRAPAVRTPAPR